MADLRDSISDDVRATLERLLRKRLFVVMVRPIRPLDRELSDEIGAMLTAHFEWLFEQERNGRLFAAGPFLGDDEQTYNGDGMFIVRAESLADARELMAREPIVEKGLRTADVRPWELNEGTISVRITYSDGTFAIE